MLNVSKHVCALAAFLLLLFSAGKASSQDPLEQLTRLDKEQKQMVASSDVDGLARLAHPDLHINSPSNRILTRDQFLASMRSGKIAAEAFERTVESASITGDIGFVMGHEVFTPKPQSELGRKYGARPLKRRYTNIYVLQNGRWLWLARHANILVGPPG